MKIQKSIKMHLFLRSLSLFGFWCGTAALNTSFAADSAPVSDPESCENAGGLVLGKFDVEADAKALLNRLNLDADAQQRVHNLTQELNFDNPDTITDFAKHTALAIGSTAAKILGETPSSTLGTETVATLAELTRIQEAIAPPAAAAPKGVARLFSLFKKPAPLPTPTEAISTQSIFETLSRGAGIVVSEITANEDRRRKIKSLREELEAMVRKNQEVFAAAGMTYADWIQNKLPEIEAARTSGALDEGDYSEQINRILELKRTLRQLFAMHLVLKQNLGLLAQSRQIAATANQQLLNINATVIPNIAQGASLAVLGREQLDLTGFIAGWNDLASKVHLSNAQQAAQLQLATAMNREQTTVSQEVILQVYGLQAATLLKEFEIIKKAAADSAKFEGDVQKAMLTLQDRTSKVAREVLPIPTNLSLLTVSAPVSEYPLELPAVPATLPEATRPPEAK